MNIMFSQSSLSDISMLFVEYQTSLLPHLPFPLHCAEHSLAIALLPRTKSYKSFYSQVPKTQTQMWIFLLFVILKSW